MLPLSLEHLETASRRNPPIFLQILARSLEAPMHKAHWIYLYVALLHSRVSKYFQA